MVRYQITDEQYACVEYLLLGKATDRGVTARSGSRQPIDAISWIDSVGAPWRNLVERLKKRNSLSWRWTQKGVGERIFEEFQDTDFEWVKLRGSTIVRSH